MLIGCNKEQTANSWAGSGGWNFRERGTLEEESIGIRFDSNRGDQKGTEQSREVELATCQDVVSGLFRLSYKGS